MEAKEAQNCTNLFISHLSWFLGENYSFPHHQRSVPFNVSVFSNSFCSLLVLSYQYVCIQTLFWSSISVRSLSTCSTKKGFTPYREEDMSLQPPSRTMVGNPQRVIILLMQGIPMASGFGMMMQLLQLSLQTRSCTTRLMSSSISKCSHLLFFIKTAILKPPPSIVHLICM